MTAEKLIWKPFKLVHDKMTCVPENRECVIYEEGDLFILNYTDSWTCSPEYFLVNVKTPNNIFSLAALKRLAEIRYNESLEYCKENNL
jgi:hypothetical protein